MNKPSKTSNQLLVPIIVIMLARVWDKIGQFEARINTWRCYQFISSSGVPATPLIRFNVAAVQTAAKWTEQGAVCVCRLEVGSYLQNKEQQRDSKQRERRGGFNQCCSANDGGRG